MRRPLSEHKPKPSLAAAQSDPERDAEGAVGDAGDRVAAWLDDCEDATAAALRDVLSPGSTSRRLIDAIAEGSPYLWDLARTDPERLTRVLKADPDERLAQIVAATEDAVAIAPDDETAMRALRRMKSEAALLIALADIAGTWPVERVIQALTEVADTAVRATVRYLLGNAARDGKLKPRDPARPDEGSGYIVLAMGKMGARELNYSSDIDLIVFYDRAAPALVPDVEAGSLFVRVTRHLVRLLQERTADGYVCRVDLRLRPDPASTQIAISREAGLDYYESVGQNWERAAMIKARPIAGDVVAGEAILKDLSPFVWRKYLDFAAVADVHAMKRQIHAYRGHGDIAIEGHNVKIGRGGIREIEFFVQTQQLIAGGRNPELRGRETLAMLDALARGGWIGEAALDDLAAAYRYLRRVEHRIQMVADEQTHTLPSEPLEMERFARFLGYAGRDAFAQDLVMHLRNVQRHYATLFENAPSETAASRVLRFPADADDRETLDRLSAMGFSRPLEASATVRLWLNGPYRAMRAEAAREQFQELVPVIIDQLAQTESPDRAIIAFDRFLASLQRGAQLFSKLRQHPDLIALIAPALGTAPRLADILALHPQVMDALIDPTFFGALPGAETLTARLDVALAQAQSYEDFLDRVRQFGQEHMFLIGARILSGTVSAEAAGEAFARLADVVIRSLHKAVGDFFASAHGVIEGAQTAVLAMGKLGGHEMTASSDLDLIVVYDFDAQNPESNGPRSLHATQYFARVTQRLVSALSAQTNSGKLYDVDMRLRPSGRSGPVATSVTAFASYQDQEAWTWEHMALTRARVVSAPPEFAARVEAIIADVLRRRRDRTTLAEDVVEMRRAIAAEKGDTDVWNLKYAAGGLIDLEFIAQFLQLAHAADHPEILDTSTSRVFDQAARIGLIDARDAETLRSAAPLYLDLTQILRLCLSGPFDAKAAGPGLLLLLARAADLPNFATLDAHLAETQERVRAAFVRILGVEV